MKEFKRVDKKAKAIWTLTRFLVLLLVGGGAALAALAIASELSGVWQIVIYSAAGAIVLALLLNMIIYPQIEYVQWTYHIDDDRIEIKKGIIWKKHSIIPVERIQHVETANGLLQRIWGLSTVRIYTAGGIHRIENLSAATSEEICSVLEKQVTKKIRAKKAEVKADA